jgi:hypothetical protein
MSDSRVLDLLPTVSRSNWTTEESISETQGRELLGCWKLKNKQRKEGSLKYIIELNSSRFSLASFFFARYTIPLFRKISHYSN